MKTPVLFVSHSGAISGAERVLLDIVRAFPQAEAFVFETGDLPQRLREAGLAVTVSAHGAALQGARRDSGLAAILPMLGTLGRITAELMRAMRGAGIVYANSQKAFTLAAVASLFRRRTLIWHLHDILSPAHFGKVQRLIQTRLANVCAARVIVPSQAAADAFVAAGGQAAKVAVVPNGVTRSVDPRSKAELRAALGLPQERFLAGVFSRLSPWKGQHVVLDALANVPEVTGIFAGAALFGEEDYARSLEQRVAALGLGERAHFLGQRSDVQLLMQAMDVVIHPSTDPEPFGLTLVEAMLAGVPLIASDGGAAAEILDNGRFGALFAPGDVGDLTKALVKAVNGAGADVESITAARARALDLYSVERMNAAIVALVAKSAGEG